MQVKKRLLVVHVAQKDFNPAHELNFAKSGFQNTVMVDVIVAKALPIYKKIDLLSGIDVFENLSLKNARDLIQVSTEEHYKAKQMVIAIIRQYD